MKTFWAKVNASMWRQLVFSYPEKRKRKKYFCRIYRESLNFQFSAKMVVSLCCFTLPLSHSFLFLYGLLIIFSCISKEKKKFVNIMYVRRIEDWEHLSVHFFFYVPAWLLIYWRRRRQRWWWQGTYIDTKKWNFLFTQRNHVNSSFTLFCFPFWPFLFNFSTLIIFKIFQKVIKIP